VHLVVYFSSFIFRYFLFVELFFHFHGCSSFSCGVLSHGRLVTSTRVEDETFPLITLTILLYHLNLSTDVCCAGDGRAPCGAAATLTSKLGFRFVLTFSVSQLSPILRF
jgi:hypothetical protein